MTFPEEASKLDTIYLPAAVGRERPRWPDLLYFKKHRFRVSGTDSVPYYFSTLNPDHNDPQLSGI